MTGYLSLEKAAGYLDVSVTTFRKHVLPHVPKHMVGRKPLFLKEDLDHYMTTRVVNDTAPRRASRRRGSARSLTSRPDLRRLANELEGGSDGR